MSVVFRDSTKKDVTLAVQMVIFDEKLTDEDIVNAAAAVLSTAVETTEEDSTYEEVSAKRTYVIGEAKQSDSLTLDDHTIEYKIPEGYGAMGIDDSSEMRASETYDSGYGLIIVGLEKMIIDSDFESTFDFACEYTKKSHAITTREEIINGRKCYIIEYNEGSDSGSESCHWDVYEEVDDDYYMNISASFYVEPDMKYIQSFLEYEIK